LLSSIGDKWLKIIHQWDCCSTKGVNHLKTLFDIKQQTNDLNKAIQMNVNVK
jgi:hypothetical protein